MKLNEKFQNCLFESLFTSIRVSIVAVVHKLVFPTKICNTDRIERLSFVFWKLEAWIIFEIFVKSLQNLLFGKTLWIKDREV